MKKLLYSLGLTACVATGSLAQENQRETIEGNGVPGSRTVEVKSFNSLKLSGIFSVVLTQGRESVKIEADENLLPYINVHNEGSKLVIDMDKIKDKQFKGKFKLKVYVSLQNLSSLESNTIGDVSSGAELKLDDLSIINKGVGNMHLEISARSVALKNTGVGDIELEGKAQNARINNSGVGAIKAGSFVVQAMDIENTGIGSAEVNVVKELKMKAGGLSKVRNKGAAPAPKKQQTISI